MAFHTYVALHMRGIGGGWTFRRADITGFPDFAAMWRARHQSTMRRGRCHRRWQKVEYADLHDAEPELDLFLRSTEGQPRQFTERYMAAASPGIIATAMGNAYYDSPERYVFAIAKQMQKEYELIPCHGFILQLDCPDLAMERAMLFRTPHCSAFRRWWRRALPR